MEQCIKEQVIVRTWLQLLESIEKTDLLGIYCSVLYCKNCSGYSNVRQLTVLYYPLQAHSQGAKGDPLHIRMHPLGFFTKYRRQTCRPAATKNKKCDTLPHPRVASDETPWLERIHFQKCAYMQGVLYCVIIPWHNSPLKARPSSL